MISVNICPVEDKVFGWIKEGPLAKISGIVKHFTRLILIVGNEELVFKVSSQSLYQSQLLGLNTGRGEDFSSLFKELPALAKAGILQQSLCIYTHNLPSIKRL